MNYQMLVDGLIVSVTIKKIKNIYLTVYPGGEARVSAPVYMGEEKVRAFVISKLPWIRRQQERYKSRISLPRHEFVNKETHYVWGAPCLLEVHQNSPCNRIEVERSTLHMYVKGNPDRECMNNLLHAWHRQILLEEALHRVEHWRVLLGCGPVEVRSRRMKSRWGTCTPARNKILLNSELAKKPLECLDYVIVHELAHLFVPNHGPGFKLFMDEHLPGWRETRKFLNSLPMEEME